MCHAGIRDTCYDINVYIAVSFCKVASASTGYVIQMLHLSGSRVFSTDSVESKIYWKDVDITVVDGLPTAGFATTFTAPDSVSAHGAPDVAGMGTAL